MFEKGVIKLKMAIKYGNANYVLLTGSKFEKSFKQFFSMRDQGISGGLLNIFMELFAGNIRCGFFLEPFEQGEKVFVHQVGQVQLVNRQTVHDVHGCSGQFLTAQVLVVFPRHEVV
jgi:hypothetical protein